MLVENWLKKQGVKPKAESDAILNLPEPDLKPKQHQDPQLAIMKQMLLKSQLPPLQVPLFDGRPKNFHETN